jgi:ribose/xylose/arabinose/galactoside ABC-type transport system permease subunit
MTKSSAASTPAKKSFDFSILRELGILLAFLIILGVLVVLSPNAFARPANFINILKQASINGILATGMMYVIISGGIDLSVGSIVALTGVVSATFAHPGEYPLIVPVVLALGIGALVGLLNGAGVAFGSIPPFIVTLGSMTIVRGLALIAARGQPVFNVSPEYADLTSGFVFGSVPRLVIYFVIITAIAAFVLTKTVFGRRVYAIGGNEIAAKVSGINVNRMKLSIYAFRGSWRGSPGLLLASARSR